MGILDRIFGSSEQKVYTLEEAMKLIEKDLKSFEEKDNERRYENAMKVHWEMNQLAKLIGDFSAKPNPELARSSVAVKERFCRLSRKQIESLGSPGSDTLGFLQNARYMLDNLGGLTQRQILHINFFFKDDFRHVAKKISEINALLFSPSENEHRKAVSMHKKIILLDKDRNELLAARMADEEKLRHLEDSRHVLPQLSKQPDVSSLTQAEAKLKAIKQEIDSFLAVQKVLKKYAYISESNDRLLAMYIESPSNALMHDNDLKIVDFASAASGMINEGKIEADKKIDIIKNSPPYMKKKREEIMEATEVLSDEKEIYGSARDLFESSLKARTNQLAEIEGEIKDAERTKATRNEEESRISGEIAKSRAELCILASKLLNAAVS